MRMRSPRWKKVFAELGQHKARSLLVVLAIALGSAGAGIVLITWAILQQVTVAEFGASNPMSAAVHAERIDAALIAAVRDVPGVADVQARRVVLGSVRVNGIPQTALLTRIDGFDPVRIGKVVSDSGAWPPTDRGVVVEASSVEFAATGLGQTLELSVGEGTTVRAEVTGIARDVGVAPGWMEHMVYLFATDATLNALGEDSAFDEVQFTVSDRSLDREHIRAIARNVVRVIEASGRRVGNVDVPEPGQHVHAAQIGSLLFTQGAFGMLAMILSCILVANLMAAVLAGQRREIGVMKAIGARDRQLFGMYLSMALAYAVLSLLLALPAAWAGGWLYARFMANMLNFSVDGLVVPMWIMAALCAVGLIMPLAAATVPVWRGCRATVADGLRDIGLASQSATRGASWFDRIGVMSRPTRLALRNAFRNRRRMLLTLMTLAFGGAVSIGAGNLQIAVRGAVDLMFQQNHFDLTLRLEAPMAADELESMIRSVPGVAEVEGWSGARAVVLPQGGVDEDARTGASFSISGPPPQTRLLQPEISAGRWFTEADDSVLVANHGLLEQAGGIGLGDSLRMMIGGRSQVFQVVGVLDVAGRLPLAYAPRSTLANRAQAGGVQTAVVRVAAGVDQLALVEQLRATLLAANHPVRNTTLMSNARAGMEDHMLLVASFLGIMGQLMLIVGGMGLASSMGMNVLERTREIGVLRAIGARHGVLFRMIQVEGLVITLGSWLLALPLSLPMSVLLGLAFGRIMLPVPLHLLPDPMAALRWLLVMIAISLCACALPAWRAMRTPAASALAYA
jgi:putative ABC transport system permease protein